jgi:hypothetical protein
MGFISKAFGGQTDDVKQVMNIGPNQGLLGQQQDFANMMKAQAAGQGPSVATSMLNNQAQQNAANMNAQAAAMRGVNPGMAMRQAMMTNSAANQQAAAQGVVARQQEQLNAQNLLGNQLNTMQSQNMQGQLGSGQLNTQIALGNSNNAQSAAGGLLNAGGSAAAMLAMHKGGMVKGYADGGMVSFNPMPLNMLPAPQAAAPMVLFSPPTQKPGAGPAHTDVTQFKGANQAGMDLPASAPAAAAPAMMSSAPLVMFAASGGKVPGKALVQGDSAKNDFVPAMLSPDELVIPRSHTHSPEAAKAFIDHVMSKFKAS